VSKVLTALVVLVALFSAGCGGGGKKSTATTTMTEIVTTTNPTPSASVTTHGRFHYPKALIDRYMQSCMGGSTKKRAYCGCTLDKLSNTVSFADFARIGFAGGKIPPRIKKLITQAAVSCANKL
jgi:hypothetical protein